MTVRLAQDIGMPLIAEYAKRFGVYDNLPPYLSYALGAGETTVMRMVTAYSMLDNGGRRVHADADRPHPGPLRPHHLQARSARMQRLRRQELAQSARADAGRQPRAGARSDDRLSDHLDDGRRRAARHRRRSLRDVGKPIAGKTGTTNDEKGCLVHRLFAGHRLRRLSRLRQAAPDRRAARPAASTAAPVVRDFLKVALADKPPIPFRVPPGIKLVRVDAKTGMRARPGDPRVILEAFKPGTAPPDSYSIVGTETANGKPLPDAGPVAVSPDADRAVRSSGTGGLY